MDKVKKVLLVLLVSVIVCLIGFFLLVVINSPGKLDSLTDKAGKLMTNSISEKKYLEIGGVKQGLFIRGEDQSKPVLLFLHGGPGTPEFAMANAWETEERLESEFVVCYWDQRGTGMSNPKNLAADTLNSQQIIADTVEVTQYLRQRFKQDKIYLLGHSWGSYVEVKTIQKYPEYYTAYLGIGQVVYQQQGQKLAYKYMKAHAKKIDDKKALKDLAVFDPEAPAYNLLLEKYGLGIRHDRSTLMEMLKNLVFFKGYTVGEKINAIKGMPLSNTKLDNKQYSEDNLLGTIPGVEVPFYVLQGRYDYQVSYELAKDFCQQIEAPDKKFYTFTESAHSPNFEEPKEFMAAVRDILERAAKLS